MISDVPGFLSSNTEKQTKFNDITPPLGTSETKTQPTNLGQKSKNKKNANTNWYLKVLKQYADFSGRARRKEYWMFALFNLIFSIVAMILDNILGIAIDGVGYGPLYGLYILAILIPGWAVTVRRLHDVGKSGWMIFINLIPVVGLIWLLVLMLTDSQQGSNKWGVNPKETIA